MWTWTDEIRFCLSFLAISAVLDVRYGGVSSPWDMECSIVILLQRMVNKRKYARHLVTVRFCCGYLNVIGLRILG